MSFDAWIGREHRATDRLDEALAARWLATFDLPHPHPGIMPQGIHFALCTPDAPSEALGEDGHPKRDETQATFLPPVLLPRRMWAASAIEFIAPFAIGAVVERNSRIASVTQKEGNSGKLAFVDVAQETRANGTLSIRETQTLVYRDAVTPDAALTPPESAEEQFDSNEWDAVRTITPDPRLLFRYSALTFNTHRIHYDLPYAREVERYRGLVVHGPLMASLLLQMLARETGDNRARHFAFRAISPAIAGDALHLAMRANTEGIEMGAFASDARRIMQATATL